MSEQLPHGWVSARITDITELNPSLTVPVLDATHVSFVPMAAVEAMTGRMDASATRQWSEVKNGFTRFQESDVVLAKITPSMENGKTALAANLTNGIGAGTTELHVFRPHAEIEARYILHYLLQETFRRRARSRMTGTAGQLRVPAAFLEEETLPLAPVPEQRRIVDAIDSLLSRLDAAVASLWQAQGKLKAYRASVLKAAVEGRLVPTEAELARSEKRDYEPANVLLKRILAERRRRWEEGQLAKFKAAGKSPKDEKWKTKYEEPVVPDAAGQSELPQGWCWATVDQLTDGARKLGYGVLVPGPHIDGGIPLIRVGDIQDGTVRDSHLKRIDRAISDLFSKTYVRGGEILISLVGTIGRTAVVPPQLAGSNVARAVGMLPPSALVSPRWIELWFRSPRVRRVLESKAHEVARKTLNLEDVRSALVALPPVAEQERLIAHVDDLDSIASVALENTRHDLARCARLRSAILKWAFEGKLADQDANDEPAGDLLARIRVERANLASTQRRKTSRRAAQGQAAGG